MPKKRSAPRLNSYIFLLINTLCWGASLVIVKPALDVTTPLRFLLYRYALALPLSLPILWHYRKHFQPKNIQVIAGLELVGTTLALSLLYAGLALTSSLEASFLTTTTPIFVVLAGIIFLREKQEKRETVGLLLAFGGTCALTVLPTLTQNFEVQSFSLAGNLLIVGQNIAAALYFVFAKRWYTKLPKLFVTSVSYGVGLVSFFALSLFESGSVSTLMTTISNDLLHVSVLWASFYMAVFGSIIGLTAYIKGQDGIEASEASLFWYLQPLVFIPLAFIVSRETIEISQIFALAAILLGVFIAEKRR